MTRQQTRVLLEQAAATVARTVPGVACLQPGLADLLRSGARRTAPGESTSGARASYRAATGVWRIELRITVLDGYRAVDVTRAVRAAVTDMTGGNGSDPGGEPRVEVTVTVTGIL
ncbi:hypothetical protein [Streptomyces tsukubensis]|uniref:Asp23/Gls24 family envelope stress response protein n=1 Tax=Streptomyces tsukubensis TaxID=83656 RepID=A0A1V4A8G2_9ACTN|nr:hypothetical protein [Streptomyces tsukubensis]OON78370.1 hypothetical protein B1H18_16385 [Streptomyces tsukubensis]QFR95132.1 Asp23/Gls24 family envelope stress response protein [Streptomyces tsukubensis]